MNNYALKSMGGGAMFETPFSDTFPSAELSEMAFANFQQEMGSPFAGTYDSRVSTIPSQLAEEFVQFLAELNDSEFTDSIYGVAEEIENTWSARVSNELAMGKDFVPFATQRAQEYLNPLIAKTERMIDTVAEHFGSNAIADYNESEVDRFFAETQFDAGDFTPAQEQLFGGILKKVKSVVKKGVNLAKKGVQAVGRLLPINIVLQKLKALVRPLLDKVLKFAIGKLPKNLQPYAQSLAKKFLKMEVNEEQESDYVSASGDLDGIEGELDVNISSLLFSETESETEGLLTDYELSVDQLTGDARAQTGGVVLPPLDVARQQFITGLRELHPGQDPTPVIEQFVPAAVLALKPLIKMGISIIGRPKVVNFIAGLLAKLVGRYVPENVAKPLASSIVDIGLRTIGFETAEMDNSDLAYEAIANTIEDTVLELGNLQEPEFADQETLAANVMEAFETAAANNFPPQYLKEELRRSVQPGIWVLMPRKGPKHLYKKFTRVFSITIDPQTARKVTTRRNLPLANFLRDKLGVDPTKPIQAKVHLYEAVDGTKLSSISKHEDLPGLNKGQAFAWVQLHPLTTAAASLLLKEPGLGKDPDTKNTNKPHRVAIGQRFYYLEIQGAKLRIPATDRPKHTRARPSQSADVQASINFIKSSISINYYLSEEDAKSLAEKSNTKDGIGLALTMKSMVKKLLNTMLRGNVSSRVKIIHEAIPELYLENLGDEEGESILGKLTNKLGGIALGGGKQLITNIIEKLIAKISDVAFNTISRFFRERSTEFRNAQAVPQDGVTVKIQWNNIGGMPAIRTIINAARGNLSLGKLGDTTLPTFPTPEIKVVPGKEFQ